MTREKWLAHAKARIAAVAARQDATDDEICDDLDDLTDFIAGLQAEHYKIERRWID